MPTDKPRVIVTLPDDLFAQIEDFRFENRYPTRSDAVLALIEAGLQAKKMMNKASQNHADLTSIGQIEVEDDPARVNEKLSQGWVIVSVGFVDRPEGNGYHRFVLGLPRGQNEEESSSGQRLHVNQRPSESEE